MKQFFKNVIQNKLKKKHLGHQTVFTHSKIYILPSWHGVIYIAIIALNVILGANYNNNLILSIAYLMISLLILCFILSYKNMVGLELKRLSVNSDYANASPSLNFSINSDRERTSIVIKGSIIESHTLESVSSERFCIPVSKETVRGKHKIERITIESRFPFGLIRAWSYLYLDEWIYVYPIPLNFFTSIQSSQINEEGNLQSISYEEIDPNTQRRYQPGDKLSRISWRQYAKSRSLIVKEHTKNKSREQLILNFDSLSGTKEERLSFLSYLVTNASDNDSEFGLKLQSVFIPPSKGVVHFKQCLEALSEF